MKWFNIHCAFASLRAMAAGRVLTAAGDGDGGGEVLELRKG